jgi:uncharacterized delta-60 repeat protein
MNMKQLAPTVIVAVVLASPIQSVAQSGTLDPTFNPGTGENNPDTVCMALQTNGQIVIGGNFTSFNGVNLRYVARLNTDGSVDSSFDPGVGPNFSVNFLAVQGDGKIFIGGSFDSIDGVGGNFARLRSDGSLDTTFTNLFAEVSGVGLQTNGEILVSGYYPEMFPPTQTNCIARLTTNGTLDVTFNPAIITVSSYGHYPFGFQSDGQIIVGGYITAINGISSCNGLARLNSDGSVDTNFNAQIPSGEGVGCLVVTPQDQIVIGGNFSTVNGYSRRSIARLNADGSVDTSFDPGLGANGNVYSVTVQTNGQVVIGGGFTQINGTNRNGVARLNSDGSLDLTFNPGTGASDILCVASQPDGRTLIGGGFSQFNGTNINGIARLYGDTSPTTNLQFMAANLYFGMYLNGTVSNTYRVEWTSKFNTPSLWTPLFDVTLQTNPQFILDPSPVSGQRFYRAVQLPQ